MKEVWPFFEWRPWSAVHAEGCGEGGKSVLPADLLQIYSYEFQYGGLTQGTLCVPKVDEFLRCLKKQAKSLRLHKNLPDSGHEKCTQAACRTVPIRTQS